MTAVEAHAGVAIPILLTARRQENVFPNAPLVAPIKSAALTVAEENADSRAISIVFAHLKGNAKRNAFILKIITFIWLTENYFKAEEQIYSMPVLVTHAFHLPKRERQKRER